MSIGFDIYYERLSYLGSRMKLLAARGARLLPLEGCEREYQWAVFADQISPGSLRTVAGILVTYHRGGGLLRCE
jgi:hypothetical protein